MKIKRITVFCASSRMIDPKYFEAARQLAELLTKNNITAVYGGGAVGFGVEVISRFVGEIVGVGVAFWLFI